MAEAREPLDITDSGATDINGDLAMSGTGTITLDAASLGADVTTVGGAIDFSGAVTGDKGSATAVGTGAGGGDVTFGSTLTLSSGGNDDLTITAGTGAVTLTGAVALNDNDLTVASSQNSVITAGISGSTGALISPTVEPQT